MNGRFYLTTPLYYVNARPHIGHAYTEIAADVLARYHRRRLGRDNVFFLTGTDEHGQKIARAAQSAGMEPQPFTDQISQTFRDLWKTLHIDYDDFIRTTEERHKSAVRRVWTELDRKGDIYSSSYEGYYCVSCETFLTEETVRQMQSEGKPVTCPDCSRPAEKIQETNFFFRMSKYQDWLIRTIEEGRDEKGRPFRILPLQRRNEVLGFLKNEKLEDLCVSRPKARLSWGIETPLSPDHVTYVWLDALVNYISACGYGQDERRFSRWWPADAHLIGKDILRHHAIYWTIILKALDLPLPELIFAHGWWTVGGEKMSKSKGNAVDPAGIVAAYGVDAYRYFLMRETPFGQDGTFSEEALILRTNVDLANNLGNLLSRTLTMCEKYFQGHVPEPAAQSAWAAAARQLTDSAAGLDARLEKPMADLAFAEALSTLWEVIDQANRFIEQSAPWTLAKQGRTDDLRDVIHALVQALRVLSRLIEPFMPATSAAMAAQLGDGQTVAKGPALFPRIEPPK